MGMYEVETTLSNSHTVARLEGCNLFEELKDQNIFLGMRVTINKSLAPGVVMMVSRESFLQDPNFIKSCSV
jgi:hypothetical protein